MDLVWAVIDGLLKMGLCTERLFLVIRNGEKIEGSSEILEEKCSVEEDCSSRTKAR
jgi:hypothetical protein